MDALRLAPWVSILSTWTQNKALQLEDSQTRCIWLASATQAATEHGASTQAGLKFERPHVQAVQSR